MAKNRRKQLEDRAAAIVGEMKAINEAVAKDNRDELTADEDSKFKILKAESDSVEKMLAIENDIQAREQKLAALTTNALSGNDDPVGEAEKLAAKKLEASKNLAKPNIIRNYNLRNVRPFSGESREEMHLRAYALGQFFLATMFQSQKASKWCQTNGIETLAQNESVNSAGAILVPDILSSTIIALMEMYGVARRFCKNWSMTSDNLTIPRRTSGVTAYFVSDGVSTTESQKGWDGVTLVAKEVAALVRYPNTLSDDAVINIADDLTFEIGYAMTKLEDQCCFIGDGTSTYGGIRGLANLIDDANHGNSVTTNGTVNGGQVVAAAGGTGVVSLVLKDFENMVGTLPQYAAANAAWFMSRAVYAAGPQRLMDAGGGNTNETLSAGGMGNLTNQDPWGRPYRTFLGFPVVITQAMTATTAASASLAGVAFLGDMGMASAFGNRKEIAIMSSKDRYFEVRQVGIQGVERFDIVNHDLGSTTAAGPVVGLKTSAT